MTPNGSAPYSYKSLNFGQFWGSRGPSPRGWKFCQFGWDPPQMKIYHTLVPHDQRWRKLNASAWKDAEIRFSVLRNFFLFLWSKMQIIYFWEENQKSRVNTILKQFQQKRKPYQFHLALERMSELQEKVDVPSTIFSWIGFKRTEFLMSLVKVLTMSHNMDCLRLVIWSKRLDNFNFLVNNEGLANLTWRRVFSLT